MKKMIGVFLVGVVIGLQACVPAAFVAGAATGTVVYDHRSTKTMVEDRNITFTVQHQLDNNIRLRRQANVSITTFNHIALLVGQTPNSELRNHAEAIAKSQPKIKMLYNEITIGKPISNWRRTNDTWITTKVKTVLIATSGLNSTTLKVVTENGVVYLMGLTTKSQANLATDKARTVAGVKKIVKLFEYIK